jgi:copper oxidase (laccase) domain-containing protein
MERLGAERSRIAAAVGPCIGAASYEVGAEFEVRFRVTSETYADFFTPTDRGGHFLFDLPGFVANRLLACGLAATETVAGDTYTEEGRYFSYRRATHRREEDYGRNLSAIVLRA